MRISDWSSDVCSSDRAAARRARVRVVTVGIEAMTFVRPVAVGDVLCCYGDVVRVGTSSIAVAIEAWKIRWFDRREERMLVTEGLFTYVAIDEQGSKRPVEA